MSLDNRSRKFRSFHGNGFHAPHGAPLTSARFAKAITAAIRQDYGETHAAAKAIMRLTGANNRTVKNWLGAKNGPNGPSLIALCRNSDRVFEAVVRLSGRERLLKAKKLIDAREKLREILELLDELEACQPVRWPHTPWATDRSC